MSADLAKIPVLNSTLVAAGNRLHLDSIFRRKMGIILKDESYDNGNFLKVVYLNLRSRIRNTTVDSTLIPAETIDSVEGLVVEIRTLLTQLQTADINSTCKQVIDLIEYNSHLFTSSESPIYQYLEIQKKNKTPQTGSSN
jgi:hypothetical protein